MSLNLHEFREAWKVFIKGGNWESGVGKICDNIHTVLMSSNVRFRSLRNLRMQGVPPF